MIKHCGGLPLGILLLGGILSKKHDFIEWEAVYNHIESYLGNEITRNTIRIEDIFTLSYNDLPSKLKPCFLYLSTYKEDVDIEVEPLYQIWMAEGLIFKEDQMKDETMMNVAERYLDELAKRCMVSVEVEKDAPRALRFKWCRLHDIMREQCLVKAEKENFIELIEFGGGNSSVPSITSPRVAISFLPQRKEMTFKVEVNSETNWSQVEEAIKRIPGHENLTVDRTSGKITVVTTDDRWLVMLTLHSIEISASFDGVRDLEVDEPHIQHVFSQKEAIRNLRSLIITSSLANTTSLQLKSRLESLLHDICVLRVLSIEGLKFTDGKGKVDDGLKVPSAIGKLIHLRYLSFKDSWLHNIPSSIENLEQLQTLNLDCFILGDKGKLKNGLLRRLKLLRHLYLNFYRCNGSKLSHDGLVSLEILEGFHNKGVDDVGVISSLKNLVSLTATIEEKVEDVEAFIKHVNDLFNIGRLRFLSLSAVTCDFNRDEQAGSLVLKHLFLCKPLKELYLKSSKISRLPEYEYHMAPNLHTLWLNVTRMEDDPMRTLEKLPNLRRLVLAKNSYEGEEMTCHADGFPQLKELKLRGLEHLKEWRVEEGAMPNLSCMEFYGCKKMKMVPDGFRFLRSLQKLRIYRMSEEFKSRVQIDRQGGEGGEDLDKISHVPSVTVYDFSNL